MKAMIMIYRQLTTALLILSFPFVLSAQKDVTKFLEIPVDGFESEMIEKLISKGYTISEYSDDILEGEFNGMDVNISIGTQNNKVWRIAIVDEVYTDEINIKFRFNTLIRQFNNSDRYVTQSDSVIAYYSIPEKEDISYEMLVNEKRYQAIFFQKSNNYESLTDDEYLEMLTEENIEVRNELDEFLSENPGKKAELVRIFRDASNGLNSSNKIVWFVIDELDGKYGIVMFYDNEYNNSDGSQL